MPGSEQARDARVTLKKRFTRPFVSHINGLGERQPGINDPFFPLFIVESGRFRLLAGDHSTKNSFDAVTCKLEAEPESGSPLSAEPFKLGERGSC